MAAMAASYTWTHPTLFRVTFYIFAAIGEVGKMAPELSLCPAVGRTSLRPHGTQTVRSP